MSHVFIVVWSGGYEPSQYESVNTRDAAVTLAQSWVDEGLVEGDTIDIIKINAGTGNISVTNFA